jgi:DNA-binding NtrC family response regulator
LSELRNYPAEICQPGTPFRAILDYAAARGDFGADGAGEVESRFAAHKMTPTILVVDDEPDLQILVKQKFRRQIRKNGYKFLFAMDGVEALELVEKHPEIDVVLSDINMPRMDGLTLLGHLNELDHDLRAVIVSAYGDMGNIRTAMNAGAFDFVTKPIDLNDLEVTINKTLADLAVLRKALEQKAATGMPPTPSVAPSPCSTRSPN